MSEQKFDRTFTFGNFFPFYGTKFKRFQCIFLEGKSTNCDGLLLYMHIVCKSSYELLYCISVY